MTLLSRPGIAFRCPDQNLVIERDAARWINAAVSTGANTTLLPTAKGTGGNVQRSFWLSNGQGVLGIYRVEARDAAKQPLIHSTTRCNKG